METKAIAARSWRWVKRPRVAWLVVGLAALSTLPLFFGTGRAASGGPVSLARRGDVVVTLIEAGTLRPAESITYRSPVVGRETEITYLIPEGSYVRTGDLLIRLDTTSLSQELERAVELARQADVEIKAADADRADAAAAIESVTEGSAALDVEEAAARLRLAEKNVTRLRAEYEGLKPLLDKGFITRDELDRAAFELDQAETEVSLMRKRSALMSTKTRPREEQRARVQLEQRDAQVANARQRAKDAVALVAVLRGAIADCTIYASGPGLVVHEDLMGANPRRRVRVGDRVSSTAGIVTIPEVERMLLDTSVREADLWRVQVGQAVSVAVDAFPSMRLTGRVLTIGTLGRTPERPFDEKRFGVTVSIENSSRELRPDMTARANIVVAERRQVLTIPVSALSKHGDGWAVALVGAWGTEARLVKVGENDGFNAEVLDGLREGDKVSLTQDASTGRNGERR